MRVLRYLGPYGGLLVLSIVLALGYYAISFKLHPELHGQLFKILIESVKEDWRLFVLLIDPFVFYLGIALGIFALLLGAYGLFRFLKGGADMRQASLFVDQPKTSTNQGSLEELRQVLGEDFDKYRVMLLKYKPLFLKAYELFKDLPASKKHHHAEPFGLFRHSVSVAYRLYKEADRTADVCGMDRETAEKVGVVLGLFHDAGKIYKGVPFKFQNALATVMLGKLDLDLPPELLSRIAYAIMIQHTEYANLDPEPLLKVLRSLDAQDTKADIEQKRRECINTFLATLKQRVEGIHHEWNNPKFFKVIYNPHKNELLVNMRIVDEVYEFIAKNEECTVPKGEVISYLVKEGIVKPVGGSDFASFYIDGIGKFPAMLFDVEKFPVRVPTVPTVPEYVPASLKAEREEFLKVLIEVVSELKDKLDDPKNPIVLYKDKEGKEWIIVKSQALELFAEKGKEYANLNDLGDRTGFYPEKVNLRSLKLNTKVIKVPIDLVMVNVGEGAE